MPRELADILQRYQGRGREALLPLLWEVQTAFGHVDAAAARTISQTLRVPEADVYGVIGFYTLFNARPEGETTVHICTDPSCALAGSEELLEHTCQALGVQPEETASDGRFTVKRTTCLGLCEHAPAALVARRGEGLHSVAPADAQTLLNGAKTPARADTLGGKAHIFLGGAAGERAQSLAEYGDYAALRRALTELTPEQVSAEVEAAGLLGRGGAAFPTGLKWKFTREALAQPHYAICNADESEPGTFKDRVLMEHKPHQVLEGLALCAYAIGAQEAYIFIRGEYPEAEGRLREALAEAEAAGLLGERVMGTDWSCRVEIRRGAGAYICGEETALFEAIEGKRGYPRLKPPYPTTNGLFDRPTAINNVETLSAVPAIVRQGAGWFRQWGTEKSSGTKLFSVSGHVRRPGTYEAPFGVTLRELLEGADYCGGVQGTLQAVLLGGAAGVFLRADEIDVPLTYEDLQTLGATMGSGAVMVFNDTVDLREVLRELARFFAHESCGKCYPCQLGTQRQLEILERLDAPLPGDRARLLDIGHTMTEASLCGLGQTAASAVLSAMSKWPQLFPSE